METPTSHTNKYNHPFVLDAAKLTRILTVIEERLQSSGFAFAPLFEVTLKNGKTVKVVTPEELLKLDNTIKNPVVRLDIFAGEARKLDVSVVFDGDKDQPGIGIRSRGADAKVASELFAEVEEQVERTMTSSWGAKVANRVASFGLFALAVATLFAVMMSLATSLRSENDTVEIKLTRQASEGFSKSAQSLATTDDKINWLVAVQREQLATVGRGNIRLPKLVTWPNFFLVLPVVIIIGCLFYLATRCYPRAVFVWGDWEEHYTNMVRRRRYVWNVVIGAIVLGVISSLFASSLAEQVIPHR